jgi:DNA-binding beta-propeller fold protein YncE
MIVYEYMWSSILSALKGRSIIARLEGLGLRDAYKDHSPEGAKSSQFGELRPYRPLIQEGGIVFPGLATWARLLRPFRPLWLPAILSAFLLLAGCIADPVTPGDQPVTTDSLHGVLVVNEGLLRQDNSTLTFYDPATNTARQDYFALKNPGMRLGDTGNDITIRGSRAYITVTTSQNVEVLDLPSGRSLGRAHVDGDGGPREVAIADDSTAFVTLVNGDAVVEFNPLTLAVGRRISVGPAPEGVAVAGERLFVANSGYGALRQSEPQAGTVSVIDLGDGGLRGHLGPGPNPTAMHYSAATGRLYVVYGMPDLDSMGGIVAYDAATLNQTGRWQVRGAGVAQGIAFDEGRMVGYVIGTGGIYRFDLQDTTRKATLLVSSSGINELGFYSIGVAPGDGDLYVGYSRGFTVPGEVAVFPREGVRKGGFAAGLNPGAFGFY